MIIAIISSGLFYDFFLFLIEKTLIGEGDKYTIDEEIEVITREIHNEI